MTEQPGSPHIARRVGVGHLAGGPGHLVGLTTRFDVTPEELWKLFTSPKLIPQWFLPITGDLREGGHYQLESNAGGSILESDPPRRLVLTWASADQDPESSVVTVDLRPDGAGTVLELSHTSLIDDDLWRQFGPGALGVNWDLTIYSLAQHLAGGPSVDPTNLVRSPSIREFMTASAAAWGAAHFAAGAEPSAAERAVVETTRFYVPPLDASLIG